MFALKFENLHQKMSNDLPKILLNLLQRFTAISEFYSWLIDWWLTPTLAVFQLYRGMAKENRIPIVTYQRGKVGIPLIGLTLPYSCACPTPDLDFQHNIMLSCFLCSIVGGEWWLFVSLILVELLSIIVSSFFHNILPY